MNLTIIVPSQDYLLNAGVRVRYEPLVEPARELGLIIGFRTIDELATLAPARDTALLFSKCMDARAILYAHTWSTKGARVGVDLFDDYFSDAADIRLSRFRLWLTQMAGQCSFWLCSTKRMRDAAAPLVAGLRCHVLPDSSPSLDVTTLAVAIATKDARVRRTRHVKAVWFGMGDNPLFPVGIADLEQQGIALAAFRSEGWSLDLDILTNPRALNGNAIQAIRRLPVPAKIKEWSPEVEREALEVADLVFLPVSPQDFSRAKSLNRATTALAAGCRVLATGWPLYAGLGGLVRQSASDIIGDFASDSDAAARAADIATVLASVGNRGQAARDLSVFLSDIAGKRVQSRPASVPVILGGFHSSSKSADAARRLGGIFVCSSMSRNNHENADAVICTDKLGRTMAVAERSLDRFQNVSKFRHPIDIEGRRFFAARATDLAAAILPAAGPGLAQFSSEIDHCKQLVKQELPGAAIWVEDMSPSNGGGL